MSDSVTLGYGTGAVPHIDDPRDHDIARIPEVAEQLAGAIPDEVDHSAFVNHVYNQGSLPSCVPTSTAGMQSVYQSMEREKIVYDATALYWKLGGDGRRGIATATVLKYAKDEGMPELPPGTRRNRIESYAFTRDINVICAALAANPPLLCVFAMMLPSDFQRGDTLSAERTSNYHQVLAVGYSTSKQRLYFLNSWGSGYGRGGFGSVPFSFLRADNNQNGAFYAYTTRDVLDSQQIPDPVRVIVGIESLAGVPLLQVASGERYIIRGKGFGARAGKVFEGSPVLGMRNPTSLDAWSDTAIQVTAGKFPGDVDDGIILVNGSGATPEETFILRREGVKFRAGTVTPPPQPNPTIVSYRSVTTQLITSVAEGREMEIALDATTTAEFMNRPMKVFWGSRELPILAKIAPNRLLVRLPEVQVSQVFPIQIAMQDTATSIMGKVLTVRNVR